MIPILFNSSETSFTGNGLGRLTDAIKCEVTEERNGIYECELQYPITGALFSQMAEGCYIYTTHDDSKKPQAYQIYFRSAPLEGICTFRAWHISYALNNIIVAPFTASSAAEAIADVKTRSINANPFTFWTDKAVTAAYKLSTPRAARSVLGGEEGSLLDVYGKGEYEFDMYNVKLYVNRGQNRGVSLRYGKNLTSLNQERDASNVYDGVVPFWTDTEGGTVALDHVVYRTGASGGRVVTHDFSEAFEDQPTTAQLEAAAQSWIDGTDTYEIKENITVDFVALWQTEEYKEYANLQRIYLCDTVNIFYEKLGINATAKCIKVIYDSLHERYTSMELGTPKTTLAQQILETTSETLLKNVPSTSVMQSAIDKATELIAGGFGGYIKFKYLSDGTPSEMLVMNARDEATATNIIRLNQNGLGFSTDGGTTYRNAWTIDGNLNADFITAGTLSGIRIVTNTGSIGGWEIGDRSLYKEINGYDGYVYRTRLEAAPYDNATIFYVQKSKTQGVIGDELQFDTLVSIGNNGTVQFGKDPLTSFAVYSDGRVRAPQIIQANISGSGTIELSATDATEEKISVAHSHSIAKIAPSKIEVGNTSELGTAGHVIVNGVAHLGGYKADLESSKLFLYKINSDSTTSVRMVVNGSLGEVSIYDESTGKKRVQLNVYGLSFYDSTGTLTKSYPAT